MDRHARTVSNRLDTNRVGPERSLRSHTDLPLPTRCSKIAPSERARAQEVSAANDELNFTATSHQARRRTAPNDRPAAFARSPPGSAQRASPGRSKATRLLSSRRASWRSVTARNDSAATAGLAGRSCGQRCKRARSSSATRGSSGGVAGAGASRMARARSLGDLPPKGCLPAAS